MGEKPTKYVEPEHCGFATKALIEAANHMIEETNMSPGDVAFAVSHTLVKIVGELEGRVWNMHTSAAITGALETSLRTYAGSIADRVTALEQKP